MNLTFTKLTCLLSNVPDKPPHVMDGEVRGGGGGLTHIWLVCPHFGCLVVNNYPLTTPHMTLRSPETTGQQNTHTLTVPASEHVYITPYTTSSTDLLGDPVGNMTRLYSPRPETSKQASEYLAYNFHIHHSVYTVYRAIHALSSPN